MKIKIKTANFIWYLAILPFLFPAGFAEYFSTYKNFRIIFLGVATTIILMRELYVLITKRGNIALSIPLLLIIVYHIILLIVTLCVQGSITQGLQKIFIAPILCIFLDEACRINFRELVHVIANLLIIIFILNLFVFNQWLFQKYFLISNHIMFIGHVQIAAEIGLVGILVAYIEYVYGQHKINSILLISLSLLTMIYSQTSASYLTITLLIFFIIIGKFKNFRDFVNKHEVFLALLLLIASIVLINIENIPLLRNNFGKLTTLFSGRTYVWEAGMRLFEARPFWGYGAYGVLINVFWSAWSNSKSGFNYAHSTLVQLLLDGGIVLALVFLAAIVAYIKLEDERLHNNKIKYVSHALTLTFLSIGLVESLTEYYYIFMFLSILPFLGEIDKDKKSVLIIKKNREM